MLMFDKYFEVRYVDKVLRTRTLAYNEDSDPMISTRRSTSRKNAFNVFIPSTSTIADISISNIKLNPILAKHSDKKPQLNACVIRHLVTQLFTEEQPG